ncbi:transposase [Mesorhizobium carmichaelinearum]|uniref:transposase n=1 Tax=Mesorhizobium carmichaelinearum TaxID=1208188 RepID=UPI001FCEA489|nr:transposase [Mesorhizobium carmichaelinearum]
MARLARIVVPGLPHHVTQRGNGRAKVFFTPKDHELYKNLLVEHCRAADVGVWAWCLMPNHVHLILTPADADGLCRALAKVRSSNPFRLATLSSVPANRCSSKSWAA